MSKIILDASQDPKKLQPKLRQAVPFRGMEESLPSFEQWRAKNDAVMVPDRGFVKQLKKLKESYEVVWDWGAEKWEIWDFPKDKSGVHVATIQTKDKNYRELGADVLLKLQAGDTTRFTKQQLYDYFDEMDNQVIRRKRRELMNKIEAVARETFSFARGVLQIQVPREHKIVRAIGNGE